MREMTRGYCVLVRDDRFGRGMPDGQPKARAVEALRSYSAKTWPVLQVWASVGFETRDGD